MKILVLGGAGYVGSHCVDTLLSKNYEVVVVDNLLTGHKDAIHSDAIFYEGDIRDKAFLRSVFQKESIDGVIHFAASSLVGVSMTVPIEYFNNNVYGTLVLTEVMEEFEVKNIVFSSTAAVYGEPEEVPILETTATNPTNPYGESKLMMEKILKWCDSAYGMKYVALRYFNVAGAKSDSSIGEDHRPETHLLPLILEVAQGKRPEIKIFGDDYQTPDGTCVRDYIHVSDLIDAHVLALEYLFAGGESDIFNLGNNQGFSVAEMVNESRKVTGHDIPSVMMPRRMGDPSTLIASSDKIKEKLNWQPKYTEVSSIIETAWNWHEKKPEGYAN